MILALAVLAALCWATLVLFRGGWWRGRENDADAPAATAPFPAVLCVVPARDEADTIAATVRGVLAQDYAGALRLVVVDDRSADNTGDLARAAGAGDPRLTVITGTGRAAGWTGKLWALQQGLDRGEPSDLIWFTDADIAHTPDNLRHLVGRMQRDRRVLVSLMARLRCHSAAERWLVPFFVLFFAMLYPFAWSNDPRRRRTAAAAGGCVLLRRDALERAGGLAAIRGAIIDDCSLAGIMKRQGPIWLGLTERAVSLRPYDGLGGLRRMVARTAYAQLNYNPLLLAGTVAGLGLVFLLPPALVFAADGLAGWLGVAAWAAMAWAAAPMLRFYGLSHWRGLALPAVAAMYLLFTLDSAWQDWRGRGGFWKGEARPEQR